MIDTYDQFYFAWTYYSNNNNIVQDAFGLTTKDFKDIVLNSVDYAFTDKETKRIIRNRIQAQLSDITRN